ncbi:MAG: hypothetical protein OXI87_11465 [Albidovulum sp.]|nr:hypothetical protein [Albidovulum sp.]
MISLHSATGFDGPRRLRPARRTAVKAGKSFAEQRRPTEIFAGFNREKSGKIGIRRRNSSVNLQADEKSSATEIGFYAMWLAAWTASLFLAGNSALAESRTISLGPPALGATFDATGLPESGRKLSDVFAESDGWQALVREMVAGQSEAQGEFLGLGEVFFEIKTDSAGPFDGLRLYVDRLAIGSGHSRQSLSDLAATGFMIGARPNSRFSAVLGEPDENAVLLSADRIKILDIGPAKGDTASESAAGATLAIDSLTLDSALGNALCGESLQTSGKALAVDLSARAHFQRNGFQFDADLILRRDGRPDIALGTKFDIKASAGTSNESKAIELTGISAAEVSRSQAFEASRENESGLSAQDNSLFNESGCLGKFLSSAMSAADKILATGAKVSLSIRARRLPTQKDAPPGTPARVDKDRQGSSSVPLKGAGGIQTEDASSAEGIGDLPDLNPAPAPQGTGTQSFRQDRRNEILRTANFDSSFARFGNFPAFQA